MKFMMFVGAAMAALTLAFATPGGAGETGRAVGVVELFTSQGCNSCPPADAVLAELGKRGDVVALGYHVDYWDYLGWNDTLATPENTARQRDYGRAFGSRSVYTPQAVINGRVHINGAKRAAVLEALATLGSTGQGLEVEVSVVRKGNTVVIAAGDATGIAAEAHVLIVYFSEAKAVDIKKGENGGRRIVYWNPVTGIHAAGLWHGKSVEFELPAAEIARKGKGGCAILLQSVTSDGAPGPILGAAVYGKEGF